MAPMDFAPEQWQRLARGPAMAALLVMRSDLSNPAKLAGEAMAGVDGFREGLLNTTTPVMQALYHEFGNATADELKELLKLDITGDDFEAQRSKFLADLRTNLALVREKGGAEDGEAYAKFVMHVAGKVANAAREGGFLGIGGQEISKREEEVLNQLRASLGV